jgi:hypothetical protein
MNVKSILCTLYLALITQAIVAQSTNKLAQGVAHYTYKEWGPLLIPTALSFTERGTWYSRHNKYVELKNEEGQEFSYKAMEEDWYITNDSLWFFKVSDHWKVPLYSHAARPTVEWQITDETQQIAGYTARKALGKSFYDEAPDDPYGQAVAWFTTDIPLPYGPDGYGGLPGLIVKLEYSARKKSYKTTLERIEYKEVGNWQMPTTKGKAEVTQNQVYNPWKLNEQWYKAKKKELKL